jgi:hypothetical protein
MSVHDVHTAEQMRKLMFLTLSIIGCSTTPSTSIDGGMIAGTEFTVVDSATMVRTNRGLANVMLSDYADTCSVADEREHPSSKQLTFLLTDADADAAPSAPGTFQLYTLENLPTTGLVGECGFAALDATCQATSSSMPCSSGTVVLTRVDDTGYAGTFDVVLNDVHVTGSFDAPTCPDVSETGFGTCQ